MLMFFGVVVIMLAVVVGFLILFANGMSDAPAEENMTYWPAAALLAVGVLLIIAHEILRTHAVHW